ncbi:MULTISPECIES: glycosyltransferase family protein [unclassified Microbacterium]|uniref:glycosyltransferase family protein n=1 Tax=unclassified Microbacterium TaxID=2609290 RepID=UPI0038699440
MAIRIALYSHDSVGLGHVRRNLAIAHALTESLPALTGEEVTGLLITGQPVATSFDTPAGWDWLVLPGIEPGSRGYVPRHLTIGMEPLAAVRGGIITAALAAFAPDLVVIDRHAHGVHGELTGALQWLRDHRPECMTVLGLRDLLDQPAATVAEWRALGGAVSVRRSFDQIWVYGDPAVHDISVSGEMPAGLRPLVRHTGYLSHGRRATARGVGDGDFVFTTVGGGSDGHALASAAAQVALPAGVAHVVVTGPEMPAKERRAIRAAAAPGTTVRKKVPDALGYMQKARAVISMGGYNTVAEAMSTTTPVLVVPRSARRQEQKLRAAALAGIGAIDTISTAEATPAALSDWVARVIGTQVHRAGVDLGGLEAVGSIAADLLATRDREVIGRAG